MTATCTFRRLFHPPWLGGSSGGYWDKQGRELLDRRLALYCEQQRMVFGPTHIGAFARMLASTTEESEVRDHGLRG